MTDNKPCGVAAATDPPLYCGYADGHDGPHSWARVPVEQRMTDVIERPVPMIDCYICGHPILEGQPGIPEINSPDGDFLWRIELIEAQVASGHRFAHMNPADHEPTFAGSMADVFEANIRGVERERAARMAIRLSVEWQALMEGAYKDMPDFLVAESAAGDFSRLAQKIRGEE